MHTITTKNKETTINHEQSLYVIPCGSEGYSCWGFENCWKEVKEMVRLLQPLDGKIVPAYTPEGLEKAKLDLYGTMELYLVAEKLREVYAESEFVSKTWFDPDTPLVVRRYLDRAHHHNSKVRIWLGDPVTGMSWLEEHDTIGMVGRSTGIMKLPLLVLRGQYTGGAILTANVIRLDNSARTLWQHEKFHLPELSIRYNPDVSDGGSLYEVVNGESVHSRHDTMGQAAAFVAWLYGEVFEPDTLQQP